MRLDNEQIRLTVIPEQGTQVWAYGIHSSHPNFTRIIANTSAIEFFRSYATTQPRSEPPKPAPNPLSFLTLGLGQHLRRRLHNPIRPAEQHDQPRSPAGPLPPRPEISPARLLRLPAPDETRQHPHPLSYHPRPHSHRSNRLLFRLSNRSRYRQHPLPPPPPR